MSRVAEMRGLTEEMMRSHEERLVGITSRRADVQEDLRETRQRMSSVHIARQEAAGALHQSLARAAVDLRADTRSTLQEIHAERTASASAQRAELRQNRDDLSRRTHEMMAELRQNRDDLSRRTHEMMEETRQARVNTANDQRASLEKDRAELVVEMAGFLGEIATARAAMSTVQQEELHAGRSALRAEVATTLAEFREGRKAFTNDLAEFGRVWRDFTEVMRARRGGVVVAESSFAREASVAPEHGRKPSAGLSGADEAAMTLDGAATYEPNSVPSDEAVFDYLADYPDGLRLVEFEEHFKAQRIRLAPILNRLIQENKARKDVEHKRYFAT